MKGRDGLWQLGEMKVQNIPSFVAVILSETSTWDQRRLYMKEGEGRIRLRRGSVP